MARIYNFSAGPSMLPEAVLLKAQQEMLDWQDSGMSVLEMSHRGKYFMAIAEAMKNDLIELLSIPENYKVLFLQGGATAQFAMIPQNILNGKSSACYVNTGAWSTSAIKEAGKYCEVKIAASSEDTAYTSIPKAEQWLLDQDAAYLHYTSNETIHGVEFNHVPEVGNLPLVCDMSSNILSRTVDINRFGIIYAGTQKNMGPAGVTVVIVREDLIGLAPKSVPSVFNYAQQAKSDSMLNTPATYNWYLLGLVLQWLKGEGGVAAIEQRNIQKAGKLYQAIDQSSLYSNPVALECRSRMNIPFVLADASLDKEFLSLAEKNGLSTLAGHRSVGGMRASIYNAMPEAGVDALIAFMAEFERTH
ncbi:3-phosphoserine/phosphohydroxythreonine aminotransferase [Methylomonas lenta]|uniref:Phosphoserine aminotransferase n=1 Tax=Methylomonas lenta TaxID=980561 RepID=A0A177MYY2_9GAMM|nr:3-phosphoserine/phosphohydroxythreonine transaminase [Methylomonas lenta]OAI10614.1 3-phosphoserine/phosphohydroxythreonine aminotransferase [Methylomonas lenta]